MAVLSPFIVALGSNYRQQQHLNKAKAALRNVFGNMRFTSEIWTEPIGMVSDMFLNCLGYAHTDLPLQELNTLLKAIENECGNSHELRCQNVVCLDIDVLWHGGKKFHEADWQRDYIKQLLTEIEK
ncbi:MAG TPA: 2-amino-4-hydroxy-6-hydroxymethyldihydropteridine diphosphokinase [Prevotella sp.]